MKSIVRVILLSSLLWMFGLGLNCEKEVYRLTEVEWIVVMIEDYTNIFHDNLFDTGVDSVSGGPLSPSFYRQITYREPRDSIVISDTLISGMLVANIREKDSLSGRFHVFEGGDWYETTFVARFWMKAYLEKWGGTGDPYNGWLIKGISCGITYGVGSFNPYFKLSVTTSSGNSYSYTSTDTSLIDLDDFPLIVSAGDTVYLHLSSIDKTDYVYLHYYGGDGMKKIRFLDNGTLDAQFVVSSASYRYRHFFVDIVDNNSVGPPPASYRARTWGIPYKIQ